MINWQKGIVLGKYKYLYIIQKERAILLKTCKLAKKL
jgi:hypothetical protein